MTFTTGFEQFDSLLTDSTKTIGLVGTSDSDITTALLSFALANAHNGKRSVNNPALKGEACMN